MKYIYNPESQSRIGIKTEEITEFSYLPEVWTISNEVELRAGFQQSTEQENWSSFEAYCQKKGLEIESESVDVNVLRITTKTMKEFVIAFVGEQKMLIDSTMFSNPYQILPIEIWPQ